MNPHLSVFNWSLKKLLSSEPDTFIQAKIKILYTILLFSLLKVIIVLTVTWQGGQIYQLARAVLMLFVFTSFLKVLLANRKFVQPLTHAMVCTGLMLIWSNAFLYAQIINVISIQFIFMLVVSAFYLLQLRFAFLYSFLATLPAVIHTVFPQGFSLNLMPSAELVSPGFEILVVLNFITILISHYLFRQAFYTNLAEKEALNIQLRQAVKEANLAVESKSDFLSTMSHELRTPLNSVIGISELLLDNAHSKEQEENLTILKTSAHSLHTLINDILDFNKLGSGKLELEKIPVEIERFFNEMSMGLRFQAIQKQIDFVLDLDERAVGLSVISDPTRLTQIIYNLGGNAIKFTQAGSVTVSVHLVSADEENICIRVSVKDTGIGISAEKLETIFEPFTQANSSTTRNFGGTGLGLAIVKRLLLLFNSAITVESNPGVGSIFSFDLSLKRAEPGERSAFYDTDKDYNLSGLRILVAEDNLMNRVLLAKLFSKWNIDPVFAFNGSEAVDKVMTDNYDLVLMDLHMPVMDGYEAAKTIRALADPQKSTIRIIALTASVSGNLSEKIRAVGIDDYILKPFKLNELYGRLKEESLRLSIYPGNS
ncbi:ATP-binding protein [Rubrolithibacter danxiaensis]|uniref:ATP-binding protein n=1 Tax=Rubrolithibacter danxiaensis TaxID=3390805 RepID=UPI003BF80F68